jgi:alkylhydroperoxidase family enzyme
MPGRQGRASAPGHWPHHVLDASSATRHPQLIGIEGKGQMPHISYVDPTTIEDPELQAIMERARTRGTPRPESQAIRLHHPAVMKAFNQAWEVFFRQGVTDHAIKELCRLYISKSVECEYCGGQRSELARQQGTTEAQVDDILDFERSDRFDDRERTALEWAMAIAWDPTLAAEDLWDRLHEYFTEPQLVELGHFIALTLGQQRFLKTVGVRHGELLADTQAGLAPNEPAQSGRTAPA